MVRILVVDDDTQVQTMFKQMLEMAGYQVSTAENGREGEKLYRAHRHDVVIIDIIMPDQEGLETIRALRRFDPDCRIIAVSGGGRIGPENYLMVARTFGAAYAFEKPVERAGLLAAVKHLSTGLVR